jgi:hypothetical protein
MKRISAASRSAWIARQGDDQQSEVSRRTEALSYNALVKSWPEHATVARDGVAQKPVQMDLDDVEN